jgi:hypothetical protein
MQVTRTTRLFGVVLAIAATPACTDSTEFESGSMSALPITSSALRGDIGAVTGLDGQNGRVNSYVESDIEFAAVDVSIVQPDGSAGMVMLNLMGVFANLDTAPSGVYRANAYGGPVIIDEAGDSYTRIDGDEEELPANDTDRVDVILCSGPELDAWEYDAPADNVVIEIEEPVVYEADPDACPECEPITTRRVTFLTETLVDDGFGNTQNRRASGALTVMMTNRASPE